MKTTVAAPRLSRSGAPSRGLREPVVLENNGGNDLSISANGAFAFSTPLAQGAAYNVTVKTEPLGADLHRHERLRQRGFVRANVTNVSVTCVAAGRRGSRLQFVSTDANNMQETYSVTSANERTRDPDVARPSPDSPGRRGRTQFPLCASRRAGTR